MLKVINQYEESYGYDPTDILCEAHMSDYASGPETDGDEDEDQWKVRMGMEVGIDMEKVGPAAWAQTEFWERVDPLWRSPEVRKCFIPV
jgi:hypothetical protein